MQNWAEKVLALICLIIPGMCRRSEQRSCRRSSRRSGRRGGAGAGAHGSRATRTLWTLKRAADEPPLKCFQAAAASNCELIMGRFGSSSRGATCRTGTCPLPLQRRHATDLAARSPYSSCLNNPCIAWHASAGRQLPRAAGARGATQHGLQYAQFYRAPAGTAVRRLGARHRNRALTPQSPPQPKVLSPEDQVSQRASVSSERASVCSHAPPA